MSEIKLTVKEKVESQAPKKDNIPDIDLDAPF